MNDEITLRDAFNCYIRSRPTNSKNVELPLSKKRFYDHISKHNHLEMNYTEYLSIFSRNLYPDLIIGIEDTIETDGTEKGALGEINASAYKFYMANKYGGNENQRNTLEVIQQPSFILPNDNQFIDAIPIARGEIDEI